MKGPRAAGAAPACFALDRERFADATRKEFGELTGVDAHCRGGVAVALSRRFGDALEVGAISSPPGLELIVYAIEDSLIVAVREEDLPSGLPVAMRQLATYSFEAKYVVDSNDGSFVEACAAVEDLLARANDLLPSFAALRRGERTLGPDGRRRRFAAIRRLAAAGGP